MKKSLFALFALALVVAGCPSRAPEVDASAFEAGTAVEHRLESFNPTCTGSGLPHVVSGVQTSACALVSQTADVTGVLAVANGGTHRSALGTGLQVLRTNAGATDTEWATPATSAGVSGQVQTSDGACAFTAPANVLAGASYVSIGASPALSGAVRLANAGQIVGRNVGGTADVPLLYVDSSNDVWLGDAAAANIRTRATSGFNVYLDSYGGFVFKIDSTNTYNALPIIGNSTPYGVHGAVLISMGAVSVTVTAAQYALDFLIFDNTANGLRAYFPTPADEAHSYTKECAFAGTGTTLVINRLDGAGAAVTLQPNSKTRVRFRPGGAYRSYPADTYP